MHTVHLNYHPPTPIPGLQKIDHVPPTSHAQSGGLQVPGTVSSKISTPLQILQHAGDTFVFSTYFRFRTLFLPGIFRSKKVEAPTRKQKLELLQSDLLPGGFKSFRSNNPLRISPQNGGIYIKKKKLTETILKMFSSSFSILKNIFNNISEKIIQPV